MRLSIFALVLAATPLALAADNSAPAPTLNPAVHGTVADATGAIIPGAEVDVIDQSGAVDLVLHADDEGNFQVNPPHAGSYTLVISEPGFETVRSPLVIAPVAAATSPRAAITMPAAALVRIVMPPLSVSTTVKVSGDSEDLAAPDANHDSSIMTAGDLKALPIFDNDYRTAMSAFLDVYDAGTVTATVNGISASASYSSTVNNTPQALASALASALQAAAGSTVTVKSDGDVNVLVSTGTGSATDYSITASVAYDTTDFSAPSFTPTAFSMQDGIAADSTGAGQVYAYFVPQDGYAPNGNLLASSDSVMGDWMYTYDSLNRLAASYSVVAPYANQYGCWTYDGFGNRGVQAFSTATATPCATGANDNVSFTSRTYNSANRDTGFQYDAAGNVLNDGLNQYLYDGEGRLCAVKNFASSATQYVYDAEGTRVAKGSLSAWPASCGAPGSNGFTLTNQYLLDLGGDQMTELTGTGAWKHSNVWAATHLDATYDTLALHFHLSDPLGTRRVQTNPLGAVETNFQSLPFGDGLTEVVPTGAPSTADDATEHHFTGKERDTESGNDYFGGRYYSSSMGRFMSPDWSPKPMPVPFADLENPQSLNLYSYVGNNPLTRTDADGHCWPQWLCNINKKVDQALLNVVSLGILAYVRHEVKVTNEHRQYLMDNGYLLVNGKTNTISDFSKATAQQVNSAYDQAKSGEYLRDFPTSDTNNWSANFNSEGEARAFARTKLGSDPVEVEPGKWRSADGKWQYRAKPGDVGDNHIHLEELNQDGSVKQNVHLRWPEGTER